MKIKVWKSKDGWRVSLVWKNGRIFATSEAYSRYSKALDVAEKIKDETLGTLELVVRP